MTVQRLATAALLHDIGKFWSRTSQSPPYTDQERDHFGTYAHALWTGHFVERHLDDPVMASWARMHHAPDSRESLLISLADWLSSSERHEDDDRDRGAPQDAALESILATLRLNGQSAADDRRWYLPLRPHGDFADGFFPRQDLKLGRADYDALWRAFETEVRSIDAAKAPLGTWMALLRKFTSRIPSATPTRFKGFVPDINLYDHSRTVAALAACFEADGMSDTRATALRSALASQEVPSAILDEPLCRLACGNLSGIQDFLYTLASKHAAKSLRGRSFALQLVADAAANWLCAAAGVPECAVIYNSGGRFYLLLPCEIDLDEAIRHLSRTVHHRFQGRLHVNVGIETLAAADFRGAAFADAWQRAGRAANAGKFQRYTELAEDDYDAVFGFLDEGGTGERCGVCGRDDAKGFGEDARCPECEFYEAWGQRLPHARWLVRTNACTGTAKGFDGFLTDLHQGYSLVGDPRELPPPDSMVEIVELNQYAPSDTLNRLRPPSHVALTYRFTARRWPVNGDGRVRTFEELAKESGCAVKLGVARGDADNLGALFAMGLKQRATISRVATLSASLSDYFEGYLCHLAETRYRDTVGIVYAGGDDFFAVGAWNHVIDFVVEARRRFSELTGDNPALSFSAGTVVVDDHLPLRHAAELAHDAEEAAKRHDRPTGVKNAFTVFDTPIGFEEMPRFQAFRTRLEDALTQTDQPLPTGFLRRLFDIWEIYRHERRLIEKRSRGAPLDAIRAEARWQRWRWQLVYGLRSFSNRYKEHRDTIEDLQQRLLDEREPIEDRLGAILRWTELRVRKENRRG